MRPSSTRPPRLLRAALGALLAACSPERPTDSALSAPDFARDLPPGTHLQYGPPISLGEGKVRTYVVLDEKAGRRPIELGVAIDARTMEGRLPDEMLQFPMPLPAQAPEPYRFVLFDWNPEGHHPPEIYGLPHFDFHFYWTPHAEVAAITPAAPDFAAKANAPIDPAFVPERYFVAKPPEGDLASVAVPGMGVHWNDVLAPELQAMLGDFDAHEPFTKTFIYGSWDGRFTFAEPMITREYLLRRTSEVIPVPKPQRYAQPGWYPAAYRIYHDAQKQEYRVAIMDFAWHD
jgi:hypothetical protein